LNQMPPKNSRARATEPSWEAMRAISVRLFSV
jgi:hypothetical protein